MSGTEKSNSDSSGCSEKRGNGKLGLEWYLARWRRQRKTKKGAALGAEERRAIRKVMSRGIESRAGRKKGQGQQIEE